MAWASSPQLDEAARSHSDPTEAATHLRQVARSLSAAALGRALDEQLGDRTLLETGVVDDDGATTFAVAPREVLHLAAGTVPGLAIEGYIVPGHCAGCTQPGSPLARRRIRSRVRAAARGGRSVRRRSCRVRRGRSLGHTRRCSRLRHRRETVRLVRTGRADRRANCRLRRAPGHCGRHRFGAERRGGTRQHRSRCDQIGGRGCMCPTVVVAIGGTEFAASVRAALPNDLRVVRSRSRTRMRCATHSSAWALRHHSSRPPRSRPLHEHDALARTLGRLGCTRVCAAGTAHEPPAWWRHDGRGIATETVRFVRIEPTA